VLQSIGLGLHVGIATLAVVVGAFLVGVGIFQIPAGFATLRWGARNVTLVGLAGMGAACLASAFSTNVLELAASRFIAGVGAAFFFSPGLSLIASYFSAGQRGPIIGLYNGGFSVGGAVGLFGGALVGTDYGWPVALAVGGVALLLVTGLAAFVLPAESLVDRPRTVRQLWSSGSGILRSRSIWMLALALTGFWAAIYIVAQFFVKYATDAHGWSAPTAAALAAAVVIVSFPGGPAGGWLAERGWDRRAVLAAFGAFAGLLVLAIPFSGLWELWPLFVLLGFADGVAFAVLYVIPSYLPESHGEGVALGVAFVNSVQVLVGSGVAVAFGILVASRGYTTAWLFAAGLSLALLPLLLLVAANRADRRSPSTPSAREAVPLTGPDHAAAAPGPKRKA
jgi:predicted MFS family arabinose efflux permease